MGRRTFEMCERFFVGKGGGGDFAKPDGTSEPHNFNDKGQGPWSIPPDVKIVGVEFTTDPVIGIAAVRVTLESKKWKPAPPSVCVMMSEAMLAGPEKMQYRKVATKAKKALEKAK